MNPPLAVLRYLAELDAALAAREAPDRDQIVTQIGEHIAQALADTAEPSEAEIAAVLTELGDPLRIADEAAPSPAAPVGFAVDSGDATVPTGAAHRTDTLGDPSGSATYPPYPPYAPPPKIPLLARSWIPAVAAALWVIGAASALGPLLLVSAGPFGGMPWSLLLMSVLLNLPLIASVVLVCCSPLFRPAERWFWALSVPGAVLIDVVSGRGGINPSFFQPNAGLAAVLMAIPPLAAIICMGWITARAYRRAGAIGTSAARSSPGEVPAPIG